MTELLSVVVATYNGESVIRETLSSLKRQMQIDATGPLSIELIVIDGGSTDDTVKIAQEFGARILHNSLGHAISAKYIGFTKASGDFVCFIDQDESLVSETSLARKLQIFYAYPNTVAGLTSGYLFSKNESTANQYASEFGDPLSLFRYRTPNQHIKRVKVVRDRFRSSTNSDLGCTVFELGSESRPTLLEIVAVGGVVARRRVIDLCSNRIEMNANSLPILLTILPTVSTGNQAFILSNDPIRHKSVSTWSQVFKKVRWRVSNATEDRQQLGASGIRGRMRFEKLYGVQRRSRTWFSPLFFVFYVLLFLPVVVDSLSLAFSRRRFAYIMNIFLAYYVVYISFTLRVKKLLRMQSVIRRYDGSAIS